MDLDQVLDLLRTAYKKAAGVKPGDPEPNWDEISFLMTREQEPRFLSYHRDPKTRRWAHETHIPVEDLDLHSLRAFYFRAINAEGSPPPPKHSWWDAVSTDSLDLEERYIADLLGRLEHKEVLLPIEIYTLKRAGHIDQETARALRLQYHKARQSHPLGSMEWDKPESTLGSSPSIPGTTSPSTQTKPEPSSSSTNSDSSVRVIGRESSYVSLREIDGFYSPRHQATHG